MARKSGRIPAELLRKPIAVAIHQFIIDELNSRSDSKSRTVEAALIQYLNIDTSNLPKEKIK